MIGIANYAASKLSRFRKDEEGVTAIEYGLIAGAIAVAIIAVLLILGEDINSLFESTSEAMQQDSGN
ncbi:MAG: Flp family type IVb pilin [Rhodospirillales bacterium]|nr:Flp family type IVb pilin [Rhodospirillales bacterium]